MESEGVNEQNFERFVVRKAVDHWRADEKVQLDVTRGNCLLYANPQWKTNALNCQFSAT